MAQLLTLASTVAPGAWSHSQIQGATFLPSGKGPAGRRASSTCTILISRASAVADNQPQSSTGITPVNGAQRLPLPRDGALPMVAAKGWTDITGRPDENFQSQLRVLAAEASDRSEMHHILAVQRDNWNSLFNSTIATTSTAAAITAAFNDAEEHTLALSIVATTLGLGLAGLMGLVTFFQPSQLAEEQRAAARFLRRLALDIDHTLLTAPHLREEAYLYMNHKLETLHALDSAFPCPLTPVVLPKFPKFICPSKLSRPRMIRVDHIFSAPYGEKPINGWTSAIETQLKHASHLLRTKDIPMYIDMATEVNRLNKALGIFSIVLAVSGALCNMVEDFPGLHFGAVGATLTVAALFVHSLSHATQLGAAYETYRNGAGYYEDVERSIENTLRTPVQLRENGEMFLEKIAHQLGRSPRVSPLIPVGHNERAGRLF